MSQTQTLAPPPVDEWLMSQTAPPWTPNLETYQGGYSIRMVTPIGRMSFVHFDKPKSKAADSKPVFSCNLLMSPNSVQDIWQAIRMVADAMYPAEQVVDPKTMQAVTMTGSQMLANNVGGLHNPLKNGDLYYMKAPDKNGAYRGVWTINPSSGADKPPACTNESNMPCSPATFYSGCYGRLFIRIASIKPRPGSAKGVTAYLTAAQFVRHGEKMSGFDAGGAAMSAFANAPLPAGAVQSSAPPGGIPGAPAGFAAPPGGIPPQHAAQPPAGFAPPAAGAWTPPPGAPR